MGGLRCGLARESRRKSKGNSFQGIAMKRIAIVKVKAELEAFKIAQWPMSVQTSSSSAHNVVTASCPRRNAERYLQWRDIIAIVCGCWKRLMGGSSRTWIDATLTVLDEEL